jgi:YVTN family beta-propeller protein
VTADADGHPIVVGGAGGGGTVVKLDATTGLPVWTTSVGTDLHAVLYTPWFVPGTPEQCVPTVHATLTLADLPNNALHPPGSNGFLGNEPPISDVSYFWEDDGTGNVSGTISHGTVTVDIIGNGDGTITLHIHDLDPLHSSPYAVFGPFSDGIGHPWPREYEDEAQNGEYVCNWAEIRVRDDAFGRFNEVYYGVVTSRKCLTDASPGARAVLQTWGAQPGQTLTGAVDLSTITVHDVTTWSTVPEVPGTYPGRVYVSDVAEGKVHVLDAASGAVTGSVTVGSQPHDLARNLSNQRIYVANTGSATVSRISPSSLTVVSTAPVQPQPWGLVWDSGRSRMWVGHATSLTLQNIA